jgi:hypothetical protein
MVKYDGKTPYFIKNGNLTRANPWCQLAGKGGFTESKYKTRKNVKLP